MQTTEQLTARLAAARAELDTAQQVIDSIPTNPGTAKLRGKQHDIRIRGAVYRAAQAFERRDRLVREVQALEAELARSEQKPMDQATLNGARFVKDGKFGTWHEVVRVNKTTVSVKTDYSWVDRLLHERIIEVRK